jgi:hypothetical protein
MVFITPIILDNPELANKITNTKKEHQSLEYKKATEEIHLWPQGYIKTQEERYQERLEDQPIYISPSSKENKQSENISIENKNSQKSENKIDKENPYLIESNSK